MINPVRLISVTNCLNILPIITIILPSILLPFPLIHWLIGSLCYSLFISCDYFVSDIRNVQILKIALDGLLRMEINIMLNIKKFQSPFNKDKSRRSKDMDGTLKFPITR
jgi:hypothetical protein